MCGIIGYVGDRDACPILIEGLEKLEYRGYDSAGICICNGRELYIVKRKGKVSELAERLKAIPIAGNIGIGHTRWATHGQPSEINAHPHLDCRREIAVVHNGIVENYYALKELLKGEGHRFVSETDSEVISHLIERFYEGELEIAVIKALRCLEGTFALAVLSKFEPRLVVARKSSPLIIGLGEGETFVASDAVPLMKHTKKVIYLNDDEIAVVTKDDVVIKNFQNGKSMGKEICEIKWSVSEIEKQGFKHFMLKEIFEQPQAIENTLRGRLRNGRIELNLNLDVNMHDRILIAACGTSWHTGLIGKHYIEEFAEVPVEVDYASEFRYRNPLVRKNDLVIVISQSGETADTLAALREAKSKGAKTLGIVNVVGSSIAREVSEIIYLHAGPEIGVASTKAFSCQVVALLLLSLFLRQQKNLPLDTELLDGLLSLPQVVREALKRSEEIRCLAQRLKDAKNSLFLGRGLNFPVALEGALKLKEISYIHAEGYPAAEMKHGPIALVDENMPVVFVAPKDKTYEKIISNMEEIKARGGNIIAVINEEDEKVEELARHIVSVPKTHNILTSIVNTIPLQLLAYHVADLKGINVDKPRNLAKSVTVE